MKKKMKNLDEPVGKMTRISDFLPPPDQLFVPEKNIKVTLSLTKISLDFFKREASQHHTKYQRVIRELVDKYARKYSTV